MAVSDRPWWWSADRADGATRVSPIQIASDPTETAEIASSRVFPGVCAVPTDRCRGVIRCSRPPRRAGGLAGSSIEVTRASACCVAADSFGRDLRENIKLFDQVPGQDVDVRDELPAPDQA